MPMVQITMLAGRTVEQKRHIARRITEVLVEEAGTRREGHYDCISRSVPGRLCCWRRIDGG